MDKILKIETGDASALYSGEATLVLKHGNRTYKTIKQHNSATPEFLVYILRCVVGGSLPDKRPGLLYLYTTENGSPQPILSFPVLYEGTTPVETTTNGGATVSYTFLIPDTFLQESLRIDGLKINALDSNGFNDKTYALVQFNHSVLINSNTNLYITWKVSIGDIESTLATSSGTLSPVSGNMGRNYNIV